MLPRAYRKELEESAVSGWLERATVLASTCKSRHRHGALVVRDGAVVGQGVARRVGNDPSVSENAWRCSYIHAEHAALRAAGADASGATLYVARVNAYGDPVLSKPCPRCAGLAERVGVARIVWTA